MKIAIVDYGAGNLASVERAVASLGEQGEVTGDADAVRKAERVIFPGVGAAGAAMSALRGRGLDEAIIDYALFGMKAKAPRSVMAMGGKFAYPEDACETPDTLQALYEFDGYTLLWDHGIGIDGGYYGRSHGVGFVGNNGTLVVDRKGWEVIPEGGDKPQMERVELKKGDGQGLNNHMANFIK